MQICKFTKSPKFSRRDSLFDPGVETSRHRSAACVSWQFAKIRNPSRTWIRLASGLRAHIWNLCFTEQQLELTL